MLYHCVEITDMKRFLKIILLLGLLGGAGYLAYLYLSPDRNINGLYLIPSDAMYILESDHPIEDWKTMSNSSVWKFLKGHPMFEDITEDADYLDEMISSNSLMFKMFGSRKFLMSAHKTRKRDYDFLFAVDLQKGAKSGVLYNTLEKALRAAGMKVTARNYKDYELIEAMDEVKDVLTLCKVENFLVCSYSPSLVEKSIDAIEKPGIARDLYFQDVYKRVDDKGIGRLYVQYSLIDDLMACYSDPVDEMVVDLSQTLRYSALDLQVGNEEWKMKGLTNIHDQKDSYLLALMRSGQSKNRVHEILSNRTAWHLSFNFSSIEKFYQELTKVLQLNESSYKTFEKSQKRLNQLLGISVKEQLIDWISDEVTVAQMRSNAYTDRNDNLVVCMRTENMSKAREELNDIAKKVKRRTPAKFKKIQYRTYEIQFLDIKGFFKTFFGKAFQKLEKPYYTTIGNYVVFSNNPLTLIGLIEDYENDRTLNFSNGHKVFRENSESKSSLTLFISPINTYPLLSKHADPKTRESLRKSKKYYQGFEAFGFQYNADGDLLNTTAYLKLKQASNLEESSLPEQQLSEKFDQYAVDGLDTSFRLQMIEDGIFKKYYANGIHLEIKAEMKDGELHGRYEEFYPSEKLKVEGKYKNGKKDGAWKYYTEAGDLEEKQRF